MAAGKFGTDLDVLAKAGTDVLDTKDQADALLRELNALTESVNEIWKGSSFGSFDDVCRQFDHDAKRLNEALESIGNQLGGTHTNYSDQNNNAGSQVTKIGNRLGSHG